MKREPLIELLLRDPNLSDAFKAVFHEDYTPEELAIEADERAPQEALERAEREAERPYWRTKGEL
jgi:hypothetical protein